MNLRDFRPRGLPGIIVAVSFVLNILLWVFVLVTFPKQSSTAVLHYTAGVGIDFIGEGWQIITLPSIGVLLIGVNMVLARLIQRTSENAFWILWLCMPFLQVLLLITYGMVLSFNT